MSEEPEPKDPAEVLKQHFSTLQMPDEKPQYVMSERNRQYLAKMRLRVNQLRGQ
jgi:hypothetical protein